MKTKVKTLAVCHRRHVKCRKAPPRRVQVRMVAFQGRRVETHGFTYDDQMGVLGRRVADALRAFADRLGISPRAIDYSIIPTKG